VRCKQGADGVAQTHAQPDSLPHERVCAAASPRRSASRTPVARDSWVESAPGSSLVSEQVMPREQSWVFLVLTSSRRAKLKRLTTDDRERMLRSRALPADFDMTQALHSPFGAQAQGMGTPMPSPGIRGSFGEGIRPLTLDTLRRVPDYEHYGQQYASPTGISPALGAFAFTPPQSATDTMSPGSAVSNMSTFSYQAQESPRRPPFPLAIGSSSGFGQPPPHMPRPSFHDRLNRPLGEPVGSPLRTSISYTELGSSGASQSHQERAASFSEQSTSMQSRPHQQRSLTGPLGGASAPYGLGFSCK
jgi:hypothetical protein